MTPLQMAKWRAFRSIQPDVHERMCDILKNGLAAVANAMGAEYKPDDFEPAEDKRQPEQVASPNQAAAIATMALGQPNGNRNR